MIDCPPAFHWIVEHMPPCVGEWVALPDPLPIGEYDMVFTARVASPGIVLRVMRGGRTVAIIRNGEARNWECRETASERVS